MSNFEDAKHQGFSRADMAQEMDEKEKRMQELGCDKCRYEKDNYMACDTVIELSDTFGGICPYFRNKGGMT